MPKFDDSNLLVGFDTSDDACVYKLTEELAVIQTVDFFPPIVDDPYLYGQIAAANSLSDIYAMGANPTLALNLLCVPNCLPPDMIKAILEGGCNKVMEAGAVIAGGHTIEDTEPKYGLCATGFLHPQKAWSNRGAKVGDVLILTKPLGTGIATTAAKGNIIGEEAFRQATDTMAVLNKYSRDILVKTKVNACTDVTGFGLLGHAYEMAAASKITLKIDSIRLPLLPEVAELASMGIIPQGAYQNRSYLQDKVAIEPTVPEAIQDILFDPQTSGGLLVAINEKDERDTLISLQDAGIKATAIGQVVPDGGVFVKVI